MKFEKNKIRKKQNSKNKIRKMEFIRKTKIRKKVFDLFIKGLCCLKGYLPIFLVT